ncbi:MAG: aspartate-semialdehyde dehydrogenase [Bacteroidetes bacterium]|nr:MAG: aspartate-semialdehyde dehydrogenase [Bacteroidota bacterium]
MRVAVVGATGLVGGEMLRTLEELNFPVTELIPVASARSVGNKVSFAGKEWSVVGMEEGIAAKPEIALFSAGGSTSKEWAPKFVAAGAIVIDNSSAWRMEANIPLVVPEVNLDSIHGGRLIANPNCSTIQMVTALAPIYRKYRIKRLVISTYQSVTGTGKAAVDQLFAEREGREYTPVYPTRIDLNCIPQCDVFTDNDYTKEEMKLVHETRKILGDPSIRITATAVRVPVIGGHSEAVNVETELPFDIADIKQAFSDAPGVILLDDIANLSYPTPRIAHGKHEVFVGRVRRDESNDNTFNCWIVADNLRKGAATNAVQIALGLIGR